MYVGAKDRTPEIKKIIEDCQWHFPTDVHFPAAFSKGLSLSQWILLEMPNGFQWHFPMEFTFVISGVYLFAPNLQALLQPEVEARPNS